MVDDGSSDRAELHSALHNAGAWADVREPIGRWVGCGFGRCFWGEESRAKPRRREGGMGKVALPDGWPSVSAWDGGWAGGPLPHPGGKRAKAGKAGRDAGGPRWDVKERNPLPLDGSGRKRGNGSHRSNRSHGTHGSETTGRTARSGDRRRERGVRRRGGAGGQVLSGSRAQARTGFAAGAPARRVFRRI